MSRIQRDPSSFNPMMIKPISEGGTGVSNLDSFIDTLDVTRSIDDGVVVFNGDGDIDKNTLPAVIYPEPALVGPSSAYWGEDVVITILNYDDDIAYSIVNNTGNSLVRDRDKITIKITNSFGQKSIFVNGKQFTFNILQFFVLAPTITSPVNGFTKLGLTAIFTSSIAYIANKIDSHIASDWQIAADSNFLNIVKETINDSTNLTSWSVSDLQLNTTYYVRVRHRTTNAGISSWSVVNQYKTKPSLYPDVEIAKLLASDGQANDYFGRLVAISGDGNTAIISAYADDNERGSDAGAAYIYVRSGTNWIQQAKLLASDGQANDQFGRSIALSSDGNTAIIGAFYDDNERGSDAGAAYIYVRSGTDWTQQAKLLASDGQANDRFGISVAISSDGNTAIIGAYLDDDKGTDAGSAYIYIRTGSSWSYQAKLLATDGQTGDNFGISVAISGDGNTAIIGAHGDDDKGSEAGAAYIYVRTGTNWIQQAKLLATDGQEYDYFGISVAISGDGNTAIIGAYSDDDKGTNAGSAYIFVRTWTSWTYQAKLIASDGQEYDYFGISVAISGDGNTAIIGAYYDDTKGSTYIYVRSGTNWSYQAKLLTSDGQANDRFGWSVALSSNGNTAIIGAYADDDKGTDAGSAYIFGTV